MTFSRPATGPVNALFRAGRPNRTDIDRVVVRQGATGSLIDFSNPAQAGANAARPYQELATFLRQVASDGGPLQFAAAMDLNADIDKFGVLSADPSFMDAYRAGDEGVRAQVNALRPEVQSLAGTANARAASLEYREILLTEAAKSPLLLERPAGMSDGEWREKRATEFAIIEERAATKSRLVNVQPEYLAAEIGNLEAVKSATKAQIYKGIAINDKKNQDAAFTNAFGSDLREATYGIGALYQVPGLTPEQRNADTVKTARNFLQSQIAKLSPFRVTSEIVDIAWGAVVSEISQATADGSASGLRQAMSQLMLFDIMSQQDDIRLPGGVSLGAYRFEDGSTVRARVAGLQLKLSGDLERAQQKEAWSSPQLMQLLVRAGTGQVSAAETPQVIAALGQLAMQGGGGAPMLSQLVSTFTGIREVGEKMKEEAQLPAVLEIETDLTRENRTPADVEAARARILSADISIPTKIRLLRDNKSSQEDSLSGTSRARSYNSLEIEQSGEAIAQVLNRKKTELASSGNTNAAAAIVVDPKLEARNAAIAATRMTETEVARLQEAGGTVTDEQRATIYREQLSAYTRSRMRQIGAQQQPQQKSYAQTVTEEVAYAQERLKQNGGQRSIEIFPKSVIDFARQQGYPITYPGLQRALIERMKAAREPDKSNTGQQVPVFPDPQQTWREMFQKVRDNRQSFVPQADQQRAVAIEQLAVQLGVGGPDLPDSMAKGSGGSSGGSAPAKTQRQGVPAPDRPEIKTARLSMPEQLVGGALNLVLGVQPAVAQDMPQKASADPVAMSMPALKVLSDLFKGARSLMTMPTNAPVLPQASALAKGARVPLAITNDKHPFFIAIGINEGTRTADGGYTRNYFGHTDPGDGAANRGTVSARAGSPQQADRKWAGILTQTAAGLAPVLQRMGLEPGTVGFNRLMFNVLDLRVQAPLAVSDFIKKLPSVVKAGLTIESIAKARADSFISPRTGRLETTFSSYDRLLRDQRSRAGAFDYKRRL